MVVHNHIHRATVNLLPMYPHYHDSCHRVRMEYEAQAPYTTTVTSSPSFSRYLLFIVSTNYSTAVLQGYTRKPLVTWSFWAWMADFFSYTLVKTAPLPPTCPYLLCCSPHGVFSFGAAISTSSIGLEKTFPGLDTRISTLKWNFHLPFGRELLHMWGAVDCSFDTLVKTLQRCARMR